MNYSALNWQSSLKILSICGLFASLAVHADGPLPSVESVRFPGVGAGPIPALIAQPAPLELVRELVLPPISTDQLNALIVRNQGQKRFDVGIGRQIPPSLGSLELDLMPWRTVGNGKVATVHVYSPEAEALRVLIELGSLPPAAVLRFYSPSSPAQVYGPYDGARMRSIAVPAQEYWSPAIQGERLAIELFIPAISHGGTLRISRASHLVYSPNSGKRSKRLSEVGAAAACHIDIACDTDATLRSVGEGVAKFLVTDSSGRTSSCTGTLITDTATTFTPYFLTANHCVSTPAEAASVQTYWFFQRQACSGADPTTETTRANGGVLLATGTSPDFTLLQLNDAPPPGVVFAGWNANQVGVGSGVSGVHHPRGDLKKISRGTVQGISQLCSSSTNTDAPGLRVGWNSGTTQVGSSGSALFNSNRQVIGTLHGGGASCSGTSNNGLPDWYGRFDKAHNCISPWIGGTPASQCKANDDAPGIQSGVSVMGEFCNEKAWHHYTLQATSNSNGIRASLQTLVGNADLYIRRNNVATESTFDCRSNNPGTNNDLCEIQFTGAATWRVSVLSFNQSEYSLTVTELGSGSGGGGGGDSGGGSMGQLLLSLLLALVTLRRNIGTAHASTKEKMAVPSRGCAILRARSGFPS